ncbi:MAG: hypothetical protein M3405_04605 [Acidobacteriota bacterium]|jgi:hypothetical protein|nr:hypothetical protein [Acidobacteriota bacterium]
MNIYNLNSISPLSTEPQDSELFNQWVEQNDICPFIEQEIQDEHIILFASLNHLYIYSVLIQAADFNDEEIQDLLEWDVSPDSSWGEVYSADKVWLEAPLSNSRSKILSQGEQMIFGRSFEGAITDSNYYELAQKLTHLLEIHFVPDRNAWCKLDKLGDIQEVVKLIKLDSKSILSSGTIISIQRKALEKYTTLSDTKLLRMFDFTRYKNDGFNGWGKGIEKTINTDNIWGKLVVESRYGSYSRGIQVADLRFEKQKLIDEMWGRLENEGEYATFIAHDWKNKVVKEISCNPSQLGNYFVESDLPFETSPAFFKPEVLTKYKTDREKYQLKNRSVSCRGSWFLKSFDVNSAGQVHAYLIDLSRLPYEEQLHWKQFNEPPKSGISLRSFKTDFEGDWDAEYDPLESLKQRLVELDKDKVKWWKLRDRKAIDKVHYIFTDSKDEWAEEILNLDQLLVEGLEEKWLRIKAKELGRNPDVKLRSLKLLEECLVGDGFDEDHAKEILGAFHEVHNLRSKLKGHTPGQEAVQIRKDVLRTFGSLQNHFRDLCQRCEENMNIIINAFKKF